jgi:Tc toxin complex TcA C-terminal TcB-binding domain
MFGRGGKTNRLYWAVYDPDDVNQDYAQSAWMDVVPPGSTAAGDLATVLENVTGLIGAAPMVTLSGKRIICLFVNAQVAGEQKLYLLRFFVDRQAWDSAAIELKPPGDGGFVAKIVQCDPDDVAGSRTVRGLIVPPALIIHTPDGSLYLAQLDDNATGWGPGSAPFDNPTRLPFPSTLDAVRNFVGDSIFGWVISGDVPSDGSQGQWQANEITVNPPVMLAGQFRNGLYHGAAWLPYSPTMPVNIKPRDGYEVIVFWGLIANGNELPNQSTVEGDSDRTNPGIADIDAIVPTGGSVPIPDQPNFNSAPRQFVYRVRDVNPTRYRRCTFGWNQTAFFFSTNVPVMPDVQDPFDIPGELTGAELQDRRLEIELLFLKNISSPPSVLTYLEEAYYFVPMQIALQLQSSGEYEAALGWFRTVYDYTAPQGDKRKIYYGLKQEELVAESYTRPSSWLSDPLNPHAVARTRGNAYTRYTVISIIRCLLEYADSEFAQDTSESLARAQRRYETAADLLETEELRQPFAGSSIIQWITFPGPSIGLSGLKRQLSGITELGELTQAAAQIKATLADTAPLGSRIAAARRIAARARARSESPRPLGGLMKLSDDWRNRQLATVPAASRVQRALKSVLETAAETFTRAIVHGNSIPLHQLADEGVTVDGVGRPGLGYTPGAASLWGCVPPNPTLDALRSHVDLDLTRPRTCRNIAGMKRDLQPYSAPTNVTDSLPAVGSGGQLAVPGTVSIQPTLYRYEVLVDRARQLAQTAAEMEAAMLSALEKFDDKSYGLLTRQDLSVAQASLDLSKLKVQQATDGVGLALRQRDRVNDQIGYYDGLLNESETDVAGSYEQGALLDLDSAASLQRDADPGALGTLGGSAMAAVSGAGAGAALGTAVAPGIGTAIGAIGGALLGGVFGASSSEATSDLAQASFLSTSASASMLRASFERRKQEWQFQLTLAQDDAGIGDQQVTIAQDDVDIAKAEQSISDLEQTNAQDAVEFLANEFTNPDLYSFMSGVLGGVYGYFLRQATGISTLAENQLAFQRQEAPLGIIQADYWAPPTDVQSGNTSAAPDRKGLTGAERLLEDITQLDQYAFLTDKRKLQLSKTFSLGRLAPAEFQRFRETGVMTFATSMELFDRDFPGHYLRLIKVIRASVVALIPPSQGIAATLSSSGLSHVVLGTDGPIPIRRDPESVAFSSTVGTTGALDLTPEASGMFLPFENTGVDTIWEFRMERASNLFDYSTIADVLVAIEYTALNSLDYRQQVIQSLDPDVISDRPFSFRNQFADQWYDLHNPDQSPTPMTVTFTTSLDYFPPNLDQLTIRQVVLYFSRADGTDFEIPVSSFRFRAQGATGAVGGGAVSIDGAISTRRGNAGSWLPMIGQPPAGDWELSLPNDDVTRNRFTNDDLQDILFVLTYSGRTFEWQP